MTPKEKAEQLVNQFRIVLMNEDTDCGNEILCTSIAIKNALIAVDEILDNFGTLTEGKQHYAAHSTIKFYEQVKQEIENL